MQSIVVFIFFFFKQKTAYEMRISDWSSDVCSTGELVGDFATEFLYPNRHRYSALAALDYFHDASLLEGTPPDPRPGEAVELVRNARQPDGTWLQAARLPGRVGVDIDVPGSEQRREGEGWDQTGRSRGTA